MGDTLADVLMALDRYQKDLNESDEDYTDDQYNIHMEMDGSFWDDGGHVFTWDLTKIYLSEQTQEVQKEIKNLLL